MPFARQLPGWQALQKKLFQFRFRLGRHDDNDNDFRPLCIAARRAKNQALMHLRMLEQCAFYRFRRKLSSGHINLVIQPSAQKNCAFFQYRQVARLKDSAAE